MLRLPAFGRLPGRASVDRLRILESIQPQAQAGREGESQETIRHQLAICASSLLCTLRRSDGQAPFTLSDAGSFDLKRLNWQ